jgi:hypothetical protein
LQGRFSFRLEFAMQRAHDEPDDHRGDEAAFRPHRVRVRATSAPPPINRRNNLH